MKQIYLALCSTILLASCQTVQQPAAPKVSPPQTQPVFGSPTNYQCDKADWENFIGMKHGGIDFEEGPKKPRILVPGNFYTQEFRADRVNLHADKDGKITHVTCG